MIEGTILFINIFTPNVKVRRDDRQGQANVERGWSINHPTPDDTAIVPWVRQTKQSVQKRAKKGGIQRLPRQGGDFGNIP